MRTQLPLPKKGHSSPHFSAHVYCDKTARWIKMSLGTEVGLGTGDIVLGGDPAPLPPQKKGTAHVYCGQEWCTWQEIDGSSDRSFIVSSKLYTVYDTPNCGQTAGWINMPLGTEVYLGPGHIVFDGDSASLKRAVPLLGGAGSASNKGHSPHFLAHVYGGQINIYYLLTYLLAY